MVQAATLDKKVLDKELAKQKQWDRVIILDNEGKIITSRNLKSKLSEEEIK